MWAWHSVIHFVLLAPGHLLHYLCCQVFHCVSCHLCCCYSPNLWRLQRPERWWELEQWLDYTNLVTDVTCRDVSFVMVWHVSWHSQTLETSDQGQHDVYEAIQAVGPHSDVRVIAGLYLETEQGAFHPAELLWLWTSKWSAVTLSGMLFLSLSQKVASHCLQGKLEGGRNNFWCWKVKELLFLGFMRTRIYIA